MPHNEREPVLYMKWIKKMEENKFFENGNVLVTGSRFVVDAQTYAMSNVTSVKTGIKPASKAVGVILILIGVICLAGGQGESTSLMWGAGLCLVGVLLYRSAKPTYSVVLNTAAGENQALISEDRNYIDEVVSALNNAIISRG